MEREHCIAKIREIIAQKAGDRRSILQLGYNLGRLSELTGLGREPFWDRWKGPVTEWNLAELERLVQELPLLLKNHPDSSSDPERGQGLDSL
jgi:hypothetical protein